MEVSSLTLKLIIILIPGILAYFIYKRLTVRPNNRSDFMFIIISVFLGILSYLTLQVVDFSCTAITKTFGGRGNYTVLETFQNLSETPEINPIEIVASSGFGIIIAYMLSWMDKRNFINRLGVLLKLTNKESDETLFANYLSKKEIEAVYVRDPKNNLTYLGKIFAFAEKDKTKEIILEDVIVYLYREGDELYTVPSILLVIGEGAYIEQAPRLDDNVN